MWAGAIWAGDNPAGGSGTVETGEVGDITLQNRGIISGCVAAKSTTETRLLTLSAGRAFEGGTLRPGYASEVAVQENTGAETATVYAHCVDGALVISTEPVLANGIPIWKLDIPAGSTAVSAPHLEDVTVTDLRRVEALFPAVQSSSPAAFVEFSEEFTDLYYRLVIEVLSYSGSEFELGDIEVLSRAKNGFSVRSNGAVDNISIRWSASKLEAS